MVLTSEQFSFNTFISCISVIIFEIYSLLFTLSVENFKNITILIVRSVYNYYY